MISFDVLQTQGQIITGTAASGGSNASEIVSSNNSPSGVLIHNTGSVDLHVMLISSVDTTANFTGTQVSAGRTYVIPAGATLPLGARGMTRIFLAASTGTCGYNAVEVSN